MFIKVQIDHIFNSFGIIEPPIMVNLKIKYRLSWCWGGEWGGTYTALQTRQLYMYIYWKEKETQGKFYS